MTGGYGPPIVNTFGMLGDLGRTFTTAYDAAFKRRQDQEAGELLGQYIDLQTRNGSPATLAGLGGMASPPTLGSVGSLGQAAPSFASGGAPRTMAMPSGDAAGVEQTFVSTVRGAGLTNPIGLGAVAAYGKAESGFSPGNVARTWSDPSQSGQAGTSGGIMSWRNERLAKLRAFAQANGDDPRAPSVRTQALFFAQEDPSLIPRLQSAQTPEEANRIMAGAWRFAGYDQPGGESARRLDMTRAYASRFGGMNGMTMDTGGPMPMVPRSSNTSGGGGARGVQFAETEADVQRLEAPMMGGAAPGQTMTAVADMPVPGAAEAQGFAIPGGSGRTGLPAASPGGGAFTPEAAAVLKAMAANPNTRGMAAQIVQSAAGGGYSFQVVGDQLVRVNSRTGGVDVVPGITKPTAYSFSNVNGRVLAQNPSTGDVRDVTPQGVQSGYRSLTTPEERRAVGIPDSDTRPYQLGPDGKLTAPPGGTTVNVDTKAETAEAQEVGKSAGKAISEMYQGASGAATNLQRYNRLGTLLDQIETGKLTPARTKITAWAGAAGVDADTLKRLGLDPNAPATAEAITSIINQGVVGQIGAGGFPANNFSDADRAFLVETMPRLSNSPGGNRLILEAMKRMENLKVEKAQAFREFKAQNKSGSYYDFDVEWSRRLASRNVFGDLAGGTTGGGLPVMNSPEDARRLAPGTRFRTPDGREFVR